MNRISESCSCRVGMNRRFALSSTCLCEANGAFLVNPTRKKEQGTQNHRLIQQRRLTFFLSLIGGTRRRATLSGKRLLSLEQLRWAY